MARICFVGIDGSAAMAKCCYRWISWVGASGSDGRYSVPWARIAQAMRAFFAASATTVMLRAWKAISQHEKSARKMQP
jgi:hypothetical protein